MKYIFTLLTLTICLQLNAQRVTAEKFVSLASKQGTLSQKLAKDFMLLAYQTKKQNVDAKLPTRIKISASFFKRNLASLKAYSASSNNEKLSAAVDVQKGHWSKLEALVKQEATLKNAVKVLKASEAVLQSSHFVLTLGSKDYIKSISSNMELASMVNVVYKQSSLSQRLALLYLNQTIQGDLDKGDRMGTSSLNETFVQMDDSLGYIISSYVNKKAETEVLVGLLSLEFDRIKDRKEDFFNAKIDLNEINEITESLTTHFDEVSYKYLHMQ